ERVFGKRRFCTCASGASLALVTALVTVFSSNQPCHVGAAARDASRALETTQKGIWLAAKDGACCGFGAPPGMSRLVACPPPTAPTRAWFRTTRRRAPPPPAARAARMNSPASTGGYP